MNKIKYTLLRLAVNVFFAYLLLKFFKLGSYYGVRLIGWDTWFIQLFCGISIALIVNGLIRIIKTTILSYLKHLQIAAICKPEDKPFKTVLSRVKTIGTIIVLNKILRDAATEILESIKSGASANIPLLENLSNSTLAKGGIYIVTKCFDYVDECVLAYCYTNNEESLGLAAKDALVIFLENSVTLLAKTTTICLTTWFVKLIITIIEAALLLKTLPVTFMNLIFIYLIVHVSGFIVNDSIVEPFLMDNIIEIFLRYDLNDAENVGIFEQVATVATRLNNL